MLQVRQGNWEQQLSRCWVASLAIWRALQAGQDAGYLGGTSTTKGKTEVNPEREADKEKTKVNLEREAECTIGTINDCG